MFPVHTKITRKGSGDVTVLFCRSVADRATPEIPGPACGTRSARMPSPRSLLTGPANSGPWRLGAGG